MDCPACGLAVPPEAFVCECGHALDGEVPVERPSSEIDLAWRQMLAGFWSISWPSMLALPVVLDFAGIKMGDLAGSTQKFSLWLFWQLLFYCGQIVSIPRLVRKNYRTWNLSVVRDSGQRSRRLSLAETLRLSGWVVVPQVAFLLIWTILFRYFAGVAMRAETLLGAIPFLVEGPYSVGLTVRVKHRGLRLEAHGHRVGTLR